MLTKGTNCNETHFINFSKVFLKLKRKSNLVIKNMGTKNKTTIELFQNQKKQVLAKVNEK